MMKKIILISVFLLSASAHATETAFYILRHNSPDRMSSLNRTFNDIDTHADKISLLIAQGYRIDETGFVKGSVDDEVISIAK